MGKIVLFMSVSVDGFFAGPNDDIGWHRVDDELHSHLNDVLGRMAAFVEGRRTYELMAGFWPTADKDPSIGEPMIEFAGIWREMPKVVYSRTLEHADPDVTIVREVVPEEVTALKAATDGDLALGGAQLARAFMRHDLIDEYRLYVHPIIVGLGARLFDTLDARSDLQLVETRAFGNGVVLLRYRRDRERNGA